MMQLPRVIVSKIVCTINNCVSRGFETCTFFLELLAPQFVHSRRCRRYELCNCHSNDAMIVESFSSGENLAPTQSMQK